MGIGADLERVAAVFHALADETRLRIIECLAEGEQCVCDLTGILDTGQSRLSFHLKTLKDAGILRDRRQGRWVYYALDPAALEEARRMLDAVAGGGPRVLDSITGGRRRRASSGCCP